jgi:sugar phosphate isomerase/epimerase
VGYARTFGEKIQHVHWKDLGAEWEESRGNIYGGGMSTIALGSGVIDIEGSFRALVKAGFDGYSTLEVCGDDAVLASAAYLHTLGAVR